MPEKKETAAAAEREPFESSLPLDSMIARLDTFYQALTGQRAPSAEEGARRPLPVERDPAEFVGEQVERLLRELDQPGVAGAGSFSPPLAVWEGDDELLIAVDVPGSTREQIEVSVEGQWIVVRGRRPLSREGKRLELCERPLGAFERRVNVPQRVDAGSVEASLADGVLELRLAKRVPEAQAKREVRVA
jgi:HSP20 family protein